MWTPASCLVLLLVLLVPLVLTQQETDECGTKQDTVCIRSCVFTRVNDWDSGFSGDLHLHFVDEVDAWSADVKFDNLLQSFVTWNCPVTSADQQTFSLTNNPWDGHHNENTTIVISFNAHFNTTNEPQMDSVKLNGEEVCVLP